jgi:PAS domain S-box-containing protein
MARFFLSRLPLRLLLQVLLAIFLAETLIMFGVGQLPTMGRWVTVIFDASVLTLLIAPLFWYWLSGIERRHRATEKELRGGEARFRELFDDAPVGYHELDACGRIVRVNRTELQLLGYAEEEMLGRAATEFVVGSVCAEENVREKLAGRRPDGEFFEREFRRKDGTALAVVVIDKLIRDADGQIVGIRSMVQNNTARRLQEIRLQTLAERLQIATESSQLGIWDYDGVRQSVLWDARMFGLYGLTAEAFDGSRGAWLERVHPEDRPCFQTLLGEGEAGVDRVEATFRVLLPQGEEREIRASSRVQRDRDGRAVRVVGVNSDVTEERRTQAAMVRARDEAEVLNGQLEIAVGQSQAFAREAVAATQAKSEFLANMSHEIRTPLNAVIGMSGLLLDTELVGEQREFAETIRSSGDALLGVINDILDYSKIESDRLELEREPFDLRECVESSLDVLAARAAEKKIDLLYWIDVDAPGAVVGDITRLRQVLVNLVGNAVKFTAKGEVFVNVSVSACLPDGAVRLNVAVRDSGIGIPADRMDRLFKTFSQVDSSTTKHYGGTGLGLAISKRLVELMGGQIWAESVHGTGSTFTFEFTVQPAPAPLRTFQGRSPPEITGRRVLVVDDNPVNRRILSLQVGSWGLLPRAVSSAAEALACLANGDSFDVAILDLRMPGMNGYELAAEIRRQRSPAQLPIVILTSLGQGTAPAELGIAASLGRPVKPQMLFDRLVEVFHGRQVRRIPVPNIANGGENLAETHPRAILIAEDNSVNLRVARLMLQRLGYRADGVANGQEVLQAVARQSYDLILMDMQMPIMDGVQATREICARWGAGERPRIVAMTANASAIDRTECLAAGMDEFIAKPVRMQDLRATLLATPARGVPSS